MGCLNASVPDRLFADRRLAAVYDPLDPDRSDLDAYAAVASELGARTVLDLGCGTGTFAVLLAARGFDVTGVDPAAASIDVARAKPGAERVRWVVGEIDAVADLRFDLVTMTGNVAQVFVADEAWRAMLATAHDVVRPGGHLVFETRDPAREAWREWTREASATVADTPGEGRVESWVEVTDVRDELVTFRSTLVFTDATITSESTLRFRGRDAVTADLVEAGFVVEDVREAPDRPGRELVFVASRPDESLARNKERGWRELGVIDEALLRGEIDEDGWHARVLDVIEPAYLAAETPQGQSGRSGDAAGWEHARRLLLDAVPDGSDVLDVGCANGLLMESLVAWAAEDGARSSTVRRRDLRPARRPGAHPAAAVGRPHLDRQRDDVGAAATVRRRPHRARLRAAAPPGRLRGAAAGRGGVPGRSARRRRLQRGEGPGHGRRHPALLGPRRRGRDLAGPPRPPAALQGGLGGRLIQVDFERA